MKMIKPLVCAALAFLTTACPENVSYSSGLILFVENKSSTDFYLRLVGGLISSEYVVKLNETVSFGNESNAGAGSSIPQYFEGSLEFYTVIEYVDDYGESDFYPRKLIKKIQNADTIVTRVEEHHEGSGGYAVYKLVVTDKILGINAGNEGKTARNAAETLYSFKGIVKKSDLGLAAGAEARLLSDNKTIVSESVSNSNGSFTIDGVPSGIYTLHLALEGYDASYVKVNVPSYNNLTYILVDDKYSESGALVKKQSVSGVISLEEGGYPNGAYVQLYKGSYLYGSAVTTNVGGSYTFYNVLKGSYTIRVTYDGYNTVKINNIVVNDENLTGKNGELVKTYTLGSRGPAGGWIVYAGDEYDYQYYGFYYIEIAPEDVGDADGKAVFGSYKYTDASLWHWSDSKELTDYIMGEYNKSKFDDVIEIGLAADYCVSYKLNGFNDWALPTDDVFKLIKSSGNYKNYNLKLTEQYWCSNTAEWREGFDSKPDDIVYFAGFTKYRFEPVLMLYSEEAGYENYFGTPDGHERRYVRPVRFF
jgi:hypothetical protein